MLKEILSAFAVALTFFAFYPYIRSILNNKIKPHVFSWVIWGSTTLIIFLAQLEAGGGVGAWPIGISGIITLYVAVLAYLKKSDTSITTIDWCFFITALASLPLWYFSADPLWAVVVLTIVDVLGFGPTFRKSYFHPFQESMIFFALFMTRNVVVILALESYSFTTVLFPAVIALVCFVLILFIAYRRRKYEKL